MNTNNTVVTAAVNLVNQANQTRIEGQAVLLVNQILDRNTAKASSQERITSLQTELAKIAGDTITPESIGVTLPTDATTDTASQKTVRNVIATLNKAKQDEIQLKSSRLVQAITNEQNAIVTIDKQVADLQAKLASLTAETVTEAQVTPAATA
jgi:hypothetical protein